MRKRLRGWGAEPAKDLTGGVWYSEQQLDTEFIFHIRSAIIKILKEMGGTGTPAQVCEKVKLAGISRVVLKPTDVQQVRATVTSTLMLRLPPGRCTTYMLAPCLLCARSLPLLRAVDGHAGV
ncbi:hypothetical protein EON67_03745 [archaeon]|nr:MAG: hypothetical protein EON67_03745 [archaeon]